MNANLLSQELAALAKVLAVSLIRLKETRDSLLSVGRQLRALSDAAQLGSPIDGHILYASKLASFEGELIYEELHKLVSLLEEIEALRLLGFTLAPEQFETLRSNVELRFASDHRAFLMVLEDRRAEWNSDWWYNASLQPGPRDSEDPTPDKK